jgi:hypothetical protein
LEIVIASVSTTDYCSKLFLERNYQLFAVPDYMEEGISLLQIRRLILR